MSDPLNLALNLVDLLRRPDARTLTRRALNQLRLVQAALAPRMPQDATRQIGDVLSDRRRRRPTRLDDDLAAAVREAEAV